jgi:hypothetical protein
VALAVLLLFSAVFVAKAAPPPEAGQRVERRDRHTRHDIVI